MPQIRLMCLIGLLLALLTQAGCERSSLADLDNDQGDLPANEQAAIDFADQLLAVSLTYLKYPMATTDAGVAPTACGTFTVPSVKLSKSDDAESHGKKIYYLFAKDASDYNVGKGAAPVGQVIVKESWLARQENASTEVLQMEHASGIRIVPAAWKDDKQYVADEKGPLFVMMKLEPNTAGTDDGWVYATLTTDGEKVTAAGKLQNCMACHVDAPRDRLFGLRYSP